MLWLKHSWNLYFFNDYFTPVFFKYLCARIIYMTKTLFFCKFEKCITNNVLVHFDTWLLFPNNCQVVILVIKRNRGGKHNFYCATSTGILCGISLERHHWKKISKPLAIFIWILYSKQNKFVACTYFIKVFYIEIWDL